MCPFGSYVYGMRAKFHDRDGLAGLVLHCKRANGVHAGDVLLYDGEGKWRDSVLSTNFAIGFRLGYRNYVGGLQL